MITQIFGITTTFEEYTFEGLTSEPFDQGAPPVDLNGDGNIDWVMLSGLLPSIQGLEEGDQTGIILFSNDDGSFEIAGGDQPENQAPRYTEYADFNNDGHLDIIIVDSGYDAPPHPGHQNILLLSDGEDGFADASDLLPQLMDFSHGLAVADVNNDGRADIFVSVFGGGDVEENFILINEGPEDGFSLHYDYVPDSVAGVQVRNTQTSAFADVNGDGHQDLIVGSSYNWTGLYNDPTLVFLGDGSGQFNDDNSFALPESVHDWATNAHDIQPLDVDADGDMDLLVYLAGEPALNEDGDEGWAIQLLINDGDGNFTDETDARITGTTFSYWGGLSFMHQVDLNGDGLIDFIPSNYSYWAEQSGEFVLQMIATGNGTFETLTMDQITEAHGVIPGDTLAAFELREMTLTTADGQNFWNNFLYNPDTETLTLTQWEETQPTIVNLTLRANDYTPNWTGFVGDDQLIGNGARNVLRGHNGDDDLRGNGGNDRLFGDNGADTLLGGAGQDRLNAGNGQDHLNGGGGNDTLAGGNGTDVLLGGNGADNLSGGNANDRLTGGKGHDTLKGGNGADTLNGNNGADVLLGGNGTDALRAGSGADRLNGGLGDDMLIGGAGNDRFIFKGNFGDDIVSDFDALSDAEKIDLSALNEITGINDLRNNHMEQVGDDVVITNLGNSITLQDINVDDLGASDFLF